MEKMVERFQCPGCVCGSDTKCGKYDYHPTLNRCISHVLGTMFAGGISFALGLPKGFNRPGFDGEMHYRNKIDVRLWEKGTSPEWDRLNVPVWAMEQDGFLFVRTYAPRLNLSWVDVIEGGTLNMCKAINVAEFIDEID